MAVPVLFEFSCCFEVMKLCLEVVYFGLCVIEIVFRISKLSLEILNDSVTISLN